MKVSWKVFCEVRVQVSLPVSWCTDLATDLFLFLGTHSWSIWEVGFKFRTEFCIHWLVHKMLILLLRGFGETHTTRWDHEPPAFSDLPLCFLCALQHCHCSLWELNQGREYCSSISSRLITQRNCQAELWLCRWHCCQSEVKFLLCLSLPHGWILWQTLSLQSSCV